MLHNTFKPIELGIVFTPITKEQLLLELFRQWFDFGVEDPFHIFQDELARWWSIRRINRDWFTGCTSKGILFLNVSIKLVADIHQYIGGEFGTLFFVECASTAPTFVDNLIGIQC